MAPKPLRGELNEAGLQAAEQETYTKFEQDLKSHAEADFAQAASLLMREAQKAGSVTARGIAREFFVLTKHSSPAGAKTLQPVADYLSESLGAKVEDKQLEIEPDIALAILKVKTGAGEAKVVFGHLAEKFEPLLASGSIDDLQASELAAAAMESGAEEIAFEILNKLTGRTKYKAYNYLSQEVKASALVIERLKKEVENDKSSDKKYGQEALAYALSFAGSMPFELRDTLDAIRDDDKLLMQTTLDTVATLKNVANPENFEKFKNELAISVGKAENILEARAKRVLEAKTEYDPEGENSADEHRLSLVYCWLAVDKPAKAEAVINRMETDSEKQYAQGAMAEYYAEKGDMKFAQRKLREIKDEGEYKHRDYFAQQASVGYAKHLKTKGDDYLAVIDELLSPSEGGSKEHNTLRSLISNRVLQGPELVSRLENMEKLEAARHKDNPDKLAEELVSLVRQAVSANVPLPGVYKNLRDLLDGNSLTPQTRLGVLISLTLIEKHPEKYALKHNN